MARAALSALVLALACGAAEALDIWIAEPQGGLPVFGPVPFVVEVAPANEVSFVELFVDGQLAGRLTTPPFEITVDVGEINAEHRFEVVVEDLFGARHGALLVTPRIRIDDVVELDLQQLYLTVTREGERITDLARDQFKVRDNGVHQEIVTFERGEVPFTAILLLDASRSMRGPRLAAALAGAKTFVSSMGPLDQARLILFSDRVIHATPFTSFPQVLSTGLSSVEARGGTSLNDHLYLALKVLEQRQGRRLIILLTDGIDVTSTLRTREVMEIARRSRSMIYWIRLGVPDARVSHYSAWRDAKEHQEERRILEGVVELSGGRTVSLESIDRTQAAFAEILSEIRDQFVLGYYPSQRRGDGKWHRVSVRVKGSGYAVRTRDGYLDY